MTDRPCQAEGAEDTWLSMDTSTNHVSVRDLRYNQCKTLVQFSIPYNIGNNYTPFLGVYRPLPS
jgi:hypothetical protein